MSHSTPHWRVMAVLVAMFVLVFAQLIGVAQPARAASTTDLAVQPELDEHRADYIRR